MARLSLKNIIEIKDGIGAVLSSITDPSSVIIEDEKGKVLFGTAQLMTPFTEHPVIVNESQIGLVKGDEKAIVIADLLNYLAKKEAEKKKLGVEILNLYKEINLVFNFSEKLAQNIDAPSICQVALDEARHVIKADNGVAILWDEQRKRLDVIGNTEEFFNESTVNDHLPVLLKILFNGRSEIVSDTQLLVEAGIVLPDIQSLVYSALKVNDRVMGAIILATNDNEMYSAGDLKLLTTLALQSSSAIESALLYEKNIREAKASEEAMRTVYEVTGKFVPFEFIKSLGYDVITDVKLGDQVEKIVTVLFSDIRGYTTLSEMMSPEENFRFVCAFNERMGPEIRKHNGFINQYLGDAIMAIFPGNPSDALSAAIGMHRELAHLNLERSANNQPAIHIGIGMHTGPLIMGITGDSDRMDATTIADTVNTASRLESLTSHYKAGIILSDACLQLMPDKEKFYLRNLGLVQLKGKQQSLQIHECFDGNNYEDISRKKETLALFNQGIERYANSAFNDAIVTFQTIAHSHPEDHTAAFFLASAKSRLQQTGVENISGIVQMAVK